MQMLSFAGTGLEPVKERIGTRHKLTPLNKEHTPLDVNSFHMRIKSVPVGCEFIIVTEALYITNSSQSWEGWRAPRTELPFSKIDIDRARLIFGLQEES